MRVLVVLASCLAVALAGNRLDENDVRIHKLVKLADQLEEKVRDLGVGVDVDALAARVDALVGTGCNGGEFRCSNGNGCVNKLLVCDGITDCNDGSDESDGTCENPMTIGSSWGGYVNWQACQVANHGQFRVLVTNAEAQEDLSSELSIDATTFVYNTDESYDSYFSEGWYAFGDRTWFVKENGGQQLEVSCTFDGYNYDQCTGFITRLGQKEPCAEVRLFKE